MAAEDITLCFAFPDPSEDMRTFKVYETQTASGQETELYRFSHPVTGLNSGLTSFYRRNPNTEIFEAAGSIEWFSNYSATVLFGLNQFHIRELRRAKKSKSQSRRFKGSNGIEYKWKIAEDDTGLVCVDATKGRTVAAYVQETSTLTVSRKLEETLDRVVVTCFLNLWVRSMGDW
ncbi:hypothetical protein CYLTODRAFT_434500 [Cylindrobasidium torrendii FP15055 ss-10]|uniref:DUF6593 domain-containing protein n=1 Tax=Cylindrobasidium torrendii FP15055 ss-10 TaxID=1314674 RepID=A0A0D7BRY0_9AGAR|nr:hypothetical protein CYLTODRAFT_434500 [Cylindrobasidium torrendii FP15055 ss-10]